jgi:serine/threonine protein kinase
LFQTERRIDPGRVKIQEICRLGIGTYGAVFKGKYLQSVDVAIKRIDIFDDAQNRMSVSKAMAAHREISNLTMHPTANQFLIDFIGYFEENDGARVCLVFELGDCDLFTLLKGKGNSKPEKNERMQIAVQIASGLSYLHDHKTVHLDLKSPNIIMVHGQAKIADLGLSRVIETHLPATFNTAPTVHTGAVGSAPWMAPENIDPENSGYGGMASDIYSLGIILWELAHGKGESPWPGLDSMRIALKVSNGNRPMISEDIHEDLKNLIKCCWDQGPAKRPNAQEARDELEKISKVIWVSSIDVLCLFRSGS